jgi:hypothetical protein
MMQKIQTPMWCIHYAESTKLGLDKLNHVSKQFCVAQSSGTALHHSYLESLERTWNVNEVGRYLSVGVWPAYK